MKKTESWVDMRIPLKKCGDAAEKNEILEEKQKPKK